MKYCEEIARKYLTGERLEHSIGTANEAEKLCGIYGIDPEKGFFAGMVHDIAKDIDIVKVIDMAGKYGIKPDEYMLLNPKIIHGLLGAEILKIDEHINDEEILSAVRLHTVGSTDMSVLDKIIYVADLTEINRKYEEVKQIRDISYKNLNKALALTLNHSMIHVLRKGLVIHPDSLNAYNKLLIEEKNA